MCCLRPGQDLPGFTDFPLQVLDLYRNQFPDGLNFAFHLDARGINHDSGKRWRTPGCANRREGRLCRQVLRLFARRNATSNERIDAVKVPLVELGETRRMPLRRLDQQALVFVPR